VTTTFRAANDVRRCTRCLYDDQTPRISFNADGVCSYCQSYDQMDREHPTGEEGQARLRAMADEIREAGRGKKYDCVVGVSGGCDSSYVLYLAKQLGLRPLAVHFDNTWNSTTATENIRNVLKALDVDLYTYVVDNEEYDDIYRSFLEAGVPDLEAPTDIALAAVIYKAAAEHCIKYTLEGHSFRTEGISPLGWLYMDGKYIQSVHKRHGKVPMKTYPNLWLSSFLYWTAVKKIRKFRPLYFIDYHKEEVKALLTRELGWKWYGGHHLENRFTAFYHSYFIPTRWGMDFRVLGYSGLVRCGQMSREEGLARLTEPPYLEPDLLLYVKKRLGYSDAEFERVMTLPKRSHREYETYRKTFQQLRPLFKILADRDLVPKTFYQKFTQTDEADGRGLGETAAVTQPAGDRAAG
jgi:N-acetyl sugar amidotransferase